MPNTDQLPALLRLFDDPSETIRRTVLAELAGWGDALESALSSLGTPPSAATVAAVVAAVADREQASHGEQEARSADLETPPPAPESEAFAVGQRVHHVRYGYRGVIVALDDHCQAPKAWYLANRTRPKRDQPWYHVLVHDSTSVTYAAQTSLAADESETAVDHPLLGMFFDTTDDGNYLRNDTPWPPASA